MKSSKGPKKRVSRWKRYLKRGSIGPVIIIAILVLVFFHSTEWGGQFGGTLEGPRMEQAMNSGHFSDGIFTNLQPTSVMLPGTFFKTMRRMMFGGETRVPPGPVPVVEVDPGNLSGEPAGRARAVWLGHSTVYLELAGRRILLDPVWADRASPSPLVGPMRSHPVPIALEALPPLDAVIISHDHYDHLDKKTVLRLASRGTRFIMPLGVGAHFEAWGIPAGQVTELNWWESLSLWELEITATPSRHFSGRSLKRNKSLWASWVLAGPRSRVFYSGDSGDFDEISDIGEKYGPFDLTILEIGQYGENWPNVHFSPEKAVMAHRRLRGRRMLPVHWLTFSLSYHAWDEPIKRTVKSARAGGVELLTPRPGEILDIGKDYTFKPWWETIK